MTTGEVLISIEQVYRYYGDYCAVNNVSFTVERGEVLGFLGPNGAGKSTTMQIISGVLTASTGSVSIAGNDIIDSPRAAKSQIGFLPEKPPLYIDLTVDEYLAYAGRLRGLRKKDLKNAILNCKYRCGLESVGHRLIGNLSKGFQQRIGIAQAIIHSPAVVILDEPTSGLDPIQIREIRKLIKELGSDHSVILSTHILPEVQTICDRALIIHNGRLVFDKKLNSLHGDEDKTALQLAFREAPDITTIESINGVLSADVIDEYRFSITLDRNSDALDALVKQSVNSCWGLFEMIPESDSLEETFMRLTGGEQAAVATEDLA